MSGPTLHDETAFVVGLMERASDELRAAIKKVALDYVTERAARGHAALRVQSAAAPQRLRLVPPPDGAQGAT